MPSVPDECECGSRLFVPVWGVRKQNKEENLEDGNKSMRRDGFKCEECGSLQLTRAIPEPHADMKELNLPEEANRDLVREE